MLGYESESELLSVDIARDIYADPAERSELIEEYRSRGRISGIEVDWKRKGGVPIRVRLSGRPVRDDSGDVVCFEMIVEDVSERRTLEAQLRQSQKMEAIGQLTGGIAHDFNNMLTVILANADLLGCEIPPDRSDLRAILDETQTAAVRGCELVKQLLSVSRRSELSLRPTELGELVTGMSSMLRRILPESVEVSVVASSLAGPAMADAGAVKQILLNLVTNSRDAMPDGGRLSLEVKSNRLDQWYESTHPWVEPGDYVSVSVTDSGVGMDDSTKEKVFEPFFTTKPVGLGTVLGMAMIYGLVKQHKGYVHVYSEVGRGTTVRVYFPVARQPVERQEKQDDMDGACRGCETILLVEDEAAIIRAAKRALEAHGYTVLLSADGDEAMRIIRDSVAAIDLIISDLVMPKKGGRELYESLKAERIDIPLIFTSGYSATDVTERAGFETDVPFLNKPWTLAELLEIVRDTLGPSDSPAVERGRDKTPETGRLASWTEVSGIPPLAESSWIAGWRSSRTA
jgi:PAS domain S-box-containing protein